jgi:acyl transferase domain-containing protein
MPHLDAHHHGDEIAIIGMAGRFPHAATIAAFWHNLCAGVESITPLSDQELLDAGVDPALIALPQYVKVSAALDGIEWFDAAFFGFSPREADVMDPQHRLFLECAWDALENAGYDTQTYRGRIGVYASVSTNSYALNLYARPDLVGLVSPFQIGLGNNKDHLATRVSYKLNLRGPSVNVQTACSSSLVATHLACQSLLNGECTLALAGGVCITLPQRRGYLYQEGGIDSPDGHCRAFDAQARGTVSGNGVGIVVLKRLTDALADGDCIHALIKGSAINNDGSSKAGYTAPSIPAQADVIAEALAVARVSAETIGYVEAHGTGTPIGDPIEIAALTQAFRASTQRTGFCAIGAVKTNIGHLDAAAGVASLIKTALVLEHGLIPPSLHFQEPNPNIDFAHSPFSVNTTLAAWPTSATPRRAGVSSFGIGGTNAHLILEAAPAAAPSGAARPWQLLVLSAKTPSALDAATANLAEHLGQHAELNMADLAYTLCNGRRAFAHRRALLCRDRADALAALADPARLWTGFHEGGQPSVVFLFPGQGAQHRGMAAELYRAEPVFRAQVDQCAELLAPHLGCDLRELLYPHDEGRRTNDEGSSSSFVFRLSSDSGDLLDQTQYAQPALFVIAYALAQLWMSWGVRPQALLGHSIGEYVAACLSGVFALDDALALVAARGRLMQPLPAGAMLAVPLGESELRPLLGAELSIAAINAPRACVVSGCVAAIAALERQLTEQGLDTRRLHTSHAFHSPMIDPIIEPFAALVRRIPLNRPTIPFVSNLTGTWISPTEATDPQYWAHHLRGTVRFADGIAELLREPDRALLEVGPGQTLTTLLRQNIVADAERAVIASMRHPRDQRSDELLVLSALGWLWLAGVAVDWAGFVAHERRRRLPLPTYPFERQRYWIEPRRQSSPGAWPAVFAKKADIADWFYLPTWRRSLMPPLRSSPTAAEPRCWLVFGDADGLGARLAQRLTQEGHAAIIVLAGERFSQQTGVYTLNPQRREDYAALITQLRVLGKLPSAIIHCWGTAPDAPGNSPTARFEIAQVLGFYSLLYLSQALEAQPTHDPVQIVVITSGAQAVSGDDHIRPEQATVLGACRTIPQEYPYIACRSIDIAGANAGVTALLDQLSAELTGTATEPTVAYRGRQRWVQHCEALRLEAALTQAARLREGGVYLITGGFGGIGLVLAEHLARTLRAKLILVSRSAFPQPSAWQRWLAAHDDDATSRTIRLLQSLEACGAEIMVARADVANLAQLRAAVRRARARFGAINGVFHAAGWTGAAALHAIRLISREQCEQHFRPKAHGLLAIERVFRDQQPDFYMLFSSLAALLGGFGFVAYAAANSYMDAFAHSRSRTSATPWISVNWDGWRLGEPGAEQASAVGLAAPAITPDEGIESIRRLLSIDGAAQIAVSTSDLAARIERWVERAAQPPAPEMRVGAHARPLARDSYVAPRDAVERAVAEVWQALLGIAAVGIHDNFFALGGHSLLATQLISRLRDALQIELPLRSLFDAATVAEQAEVIAALRGVAPALPEPPLCPVAREQPLPLSFAQQRLWFLDQLEPNSATYNVPTAVRLSGALDVVAFGRSLDAIIERHEILRTTFVVVDDQPAQLIGVARPVALRLIDLQVLPAVEREATTLRLAQAEIQRPFALAHGPLLRATLLRLAPAEHALLLTTHHIVSDGWSMNIFVRELVTLYSAYTAGQPATLPALPLQYADYAIWQRALLQGAFLEAQLAYWRRTLADLPELHLPLDRPPPQVATSQGASHAFFLPLELRSALTGLGRSQGATLFMTLLAVFLVLLHYNTHAEDLVIGTDVANRTRGAIEGLIGFFVNQLVIRADLAGDPTFPELLERVRDRVLAASAHQDLPFDKLVEALNPQRDPGRHPLFQVKFVFQNVPPPVIAASELRVSLLAVAQQSARFDLCLLIDESAQGLHGKLEYSTDLFDATTIMRMAEHFALLLRSVVAQPAASLAQLEALLADADRRERISSDKVFEATSLQKLKNVRRRAVPISGGA